MGRFSQHTLYQDTISRHSANERLWFDAPPFAPERLRGVLAVDVHGGSAHFAQHAQARGGAVDEAAAAHAAGRAGRGQLAAQAQRAPGQRARRQAHAAQQRAHALLRASAKPLMRWARDAAHSAGNQRQSINRQQQRRETRKRCERNPHHFLRCSNNQTSCTFSEQHANQQTNSNICIFNRSSKPLDTSCSAHYSRYAPLSSPCMFSKHRLSETLFRHVRAQPTCMAGDRRTVASTAATSFLGTPCEGRMQFSAAGAPSACPSALTSTWQIRRVDDLPGVKYHRVCGVSSVQVCTPSCRLDADVPQHLHQHFHGTYKSGSLCRPQGHDVYTSKVSSMH